MEPIPSHNGGSVYAKAGADVATLISARGTSVCASRSSMLGTPIAAGVWQIGKSGPLNGDEEALAAVAPASATVTRLPVSNISSTEPPSAAAPTDARNFCDGVNAAMSSSKIRRQN